MKNKLFLYCIGLLFPMISASQGNMYNPYSRYGIGLLSQNTLAHNTGMGGASIALRSDSTMPIFINTGNPASYAFIRMSTLELGGSFVYSKFKSGKSALTKWNSNFSYGAIGLPIRSNGGLCFGLMPLTEVGYETSAIVNQPGIGNIEYQYEGIGGLNKLFAGYGILPFKKRLNKFRSKQLYIPDSMRVLTHGQYMRKERLNKLINDLSVGFNVNYIFGSVINTSRVILPNSLLYTNTFRERTLNVAGVTGNFGLQTAFTVDSIKNHKERRLQYKMLEKRLANNELSKEEYGRKKDSLGNQPLNRRVFRDKVKFTFGYFMNINNEMNAKYNNSVLNYQLTSAGQEIVRDTVLYITDRKTKMALPLEQGFGIGLKKGEKINLVADFALTNWQNFKTFNEVN
ncbi:MAG: hypothetical protein JNL60_05010, partial [Bacteroidia bacterium]|nr:hypothetical protein [Bacteroidia bacterium]